MESAARNTLESTYAPSAVKVQGLFKSFKGQPALQGVDLQVAPGEMVALVGASGSGKSTLLRNINGLQEAQAGTVEIYSSVLQKDGQLHSQVRSLRGQIGCIFQQFNLVNRLTVIENVMVGNLPKLSLGRSLLRLF